MVVASVSSLLTDSICAVCALAVRVFPAVKFMQLNEDSLFFLFH